jgi:hypothetical protein
MTPFCAGGHPGTRGPNRGDDQKVSRRISVSAVLHGGIYWLRTASALRAYAASTYKIEDFPHLRCPLESPSWDARPKTRWHPMAAGVSIWRQLVTPSSKSMSKMKGVIHASFYRGSADPPDFAWHFRSWKTETGMGADHLDGLVLRGSRARMVPGHDG